MFCDRVDEESFNKMNDDMDAVREQVDKRRMQEDKFSQHARDQEDKSSQDARAHHKEAFETEKDAIAANQYRNNCKFSCKLCTSSNRI